MSNLTQEWNCVKRIGSGVRKLQKTRQVSCDLSSFKALEMFLLECDSMHLPCVRDRCQITSDFSIKLLLLVVCETNMKLIYNVELTPWLFILSHVIPLTPQNVNCVMLHIKAFVWDLSLSNLQASLSQVPPPLEAYTIQITIVLLEGDVTQK